MQIILDTNIIIAGLIKRSILLFKILEFYLGGHEFLIPEYAKEEIFNKFEKIKEYSGLKNEELKYILNVLFKLIKIIPEKEVLDRWKEAYNIAKQFDEKDTPFIALALKLNIPIWTNDKEMIKYGLITGKYLALDTEALEELIKGKSIEEIKEELKRKYFQ